MNDKSNLLGLKYTRSFVFDFLRRIQQPLQLGQGLLQCRMRRKANTQFEQLPKRIQRHIAFFQVASASVQLVVGDVRFRVPNRVSSQQILILFDPFRLLDSLYLARGGKETLVGGKLSADEVKGKPEEK